MEDVHIIRWTGDDPELACLQFGQKGGVNPCVNALQPASSLQANEISLRLAYV